MIAAIVMGNLGAAHRDLSALLASDGDLEPFHPAVQLAHASLVSCDRDGQWGPEIRTHERGADMLALERELSPLTDCLLDAPDDWRSTLQRVVDGLETFLKNSVEGVESG